MKSVYVLIHEPMGLNAIVGVFESGSKLAQSARAMTTDIIEDCVVKTVPLNSVRYYHDHQGTRLSEFLRSPISEEAHAT